MYNFQKQVEEYLSSLKEQGNYRQLRENSDQNLIDLTSNDYLDLALLKRTDYLNFKYHYQVSTKETEIVYNSLSIGSTGSRLLSGNVDSVIELEDFCNKLIAPYNKHTLVFNSGYHANIGIISSIAKLKTKSIVLMDQLMHASFIDGVLLSGLKFRRFKHNNLQHVESLLQQAIEKNYTNVVIAFETVYSMDGDGFSTEELQELINLKHKYSNINIILYADEAHAIGLFGTYALGKCEEAKIIKEVDVITCPMGKALNSMGSLVFTSQWLREYLINTSRPFIYSTALPSEVYSTAKTSLKFCQSKKCKEQVKLLLRYATHFRQFLNEQLNSIKRTDINFYITGDNQIVSLILGSNEKVNFAREYFAKLDCTVSAIKYPTVPKGTERIRICLRVSIAENKKLQNFIESAFANFIKNYC